MRLYVDLPTSKLIVRPGTTERPFLEQKRGDSSRIEVIFVDGLVVQELAAGATGKLGIKASGDYAGSYLVSDLTWTKEGTGTSTIYVFEPSFNTTELNTVIAALTSPAYYIDAEFEVEWVADGARSSTAHQTIRIYNDVNKGDEGVPTSGSPVYPASDEVVAYTDQSALAKTDADKALARTNIRAADALYEPLAVTEDSSGSALVFLTTTAYERIVVPDATVDSVYLPTGVEADVGRVILIRATHQDLSMNDDTGSLSTTVKNGELASFRAVSWSGFELGWQRVGLDPSVLATKNGIGSPVEIQLAASDETSDLTTGEGKLTFRAPHAITLTEVRASVTTAPTGAAIIVDVNDDGTSIMTTNKLSIDAGEKTSTTAATAAVLTDTAIADDAEITIDIDQIGSTIAGAGLKITLIGTRA